MLKELGLTGHGVEVGTGSGWYSNILLQESDLSRLYSIDPWNKPANSSVRCLAESSLYPAAVALLMRHGLRSVVLRMESIEAAKLFSDRSLDFVYIDSNHGYKWIVEDIESWAPKVRSGGILAGHDYCATRFDVKRAVDEFVTRTGHTLHLSTLDQYAGENNEHEIRSWLIGK